MKPFRWNIDKRNELGTLIDHNQIEIPADFTNELISSSARILAFAGNSFIYFVGRSPEDYYDLNIGSLIEGWCKKKLVFASPLLPFGTVWEAHSYCTHLQIAQADPQTKICKRVQFLPVQ